MLRLFFLRESLCLMGINVRAGVTPQTSLVGCLSLASSCVIFNLRSYTGKSTYVTLKLNTLFFKSLFLGMSNDPNLNPAQSIRGWGTKEENCNKIKIKKVVQPPAVATREKKKNGTASWKFLFKNRFFRDKYILHIGGFTSSFKHIRVKIKMMKFHVD